MSEGLKENFVNAVNDALRHKGAGSINQATLNEIASMLLNPAAVKALSGDQAVKNAMAGSTELTHMTLLMVYALNSNDPRLVGPLIDLGCDKDAKNSKQASAVEIAAFEEHNKFRDALIKADAKDAGRARLIKTRRQLIEENPAYSF